MRIALVIEHLDHRRGGAETYVHDFSRYALGRGHEVTIVTQSAHEPPAGAKVRLVRPLVLTPGFKATAFARQAAEVLRELQPETSMATGKALGMRVYQPHGGTVRGSQRQNLALIRSDAVRALKVIFNRVNPKHRAARRLETDQFTDPDSHFIAISEMVRRDMQTFYGLRDERITLVYNGIDLQRFHPARLLPLREAARRKFAVPAAALLFLFAGHNFKLKGLRELLVAMSRLKAARDIAGGATGITSEFRLLVVGGGPETRYRALAEQLEVTELVTFAGACPDLAPCYAAADAFVHPTWYDPCSLVVLEALAAGLPCITTRFNGVAELMDGREAGFVLDAPRPVSLLTGAMIEMFDPAARRAMSAAARQLAEEHPQERNFAEVLACLERAAARKR